jgi:hypothetical protein
MAAQETSAETRRFKVFRFKRGGHDGEHFDEFVVPVAPHTTVLEPCSGSSFIVTEPSRCVIRACTPLAAPAGCW